MRKVTIYFLLAEVLDLITTMVGLRLGMVELNPVFNKAEWEILFLIKIIGTIIVVIALERKKKQKIDVIFPIVALIPVLWNCLNLVLTW